MRKKLAIGLTTLVLATGPIVRAEDQTLLMLNDDQITQIRLNCVEVQSTLQRLHSSDALLRVNLGQRYEAIATKLMTPMNNRVALNRVDSAPITKTTTDFNNTLDDFRERYKQYEQSMTRALQVKCQDQPVAFFDAVTLARIHRANLREVVVKLNSQLAQYREQIDTIRQRMQSEEAKKS